MPLIDREHTDNVLLIDREFAELKNDAECASLPKLTKLVKKLFNPTRLGKEKPHCPISHSLTRFAEPDRWPHFCFVENLTSLTGLIDDLAIGGAESRVKEVAIGFFG